jgi:DNA polymerase-3 subunit epsilon
VPSKEEPSYGIFKTKKQAIDAVQEIVKEKGLCPILLGIESGKGACFSHQLEICQGACVGKIEPIVYNILLEQAFVSRKVRTWPHKGPKILSYTNKINRKTEEFVVDNWILIDATLSTDKDIEEFIIPQNTFDFEMYKVLAKYL